MPRYIDANKIKLTGLTFEDINNEVYFSLTDVRKAIEQTPTADVVEVVRCKDCKFHLANSCFNRQWDLESSTEVPMVCDCDFCSYGERKGQK